MVDHISIDVTDAKQSAVPKDKFRINKYDFGTQFEDLVHNSVPYLHFQIIIVENRLKLPNKIKNTKYKNYCHEETNSIILI